MATKNEHNENEEDAGEEMTKEEAPRLQEDGNAHQEEVKDSTTKQKRDNENDDEHEEESAESRTNKNEQELLRDSTATTVLENHDDLQGSCPAKPGYVADEVDAADIAFPTELPGRRNIPRPGAFAQEGPGAIRVDHNDSLPSSSITFNTSGSSVPPLVPVPLIVSATLVVEEEEEEEDEENPRGVDAPRQQQITNAMCERPQQPAAAAQPVLAYAEPMDPVVEPPKDRARRAFYLCIAVVGIIALVVGLSLALVEEDDDKKDGRGRDKDNISPPSVLPSNRNASDLEFLLKQPNVSGHVVQWGFFTDGCESDHMELPLVELRCHSLNNTNTTTTEEVDVAILETRYAYCERQDRNYVTCRLQSQQPNKNNSTDMYGSALVACGGTAFEHVEHSMSLKAKLPALTANSCSKWIRNEPRPGGRDVDIVGGRLTQWLSVGRFCRDRREEEEDIYVQSAIDCGQGTKLRLPFVDAEDGEDPTVVERKQLFCWETNACETYAPLNDEEASCPALVHQVCVANHLPIRIYRECSFAQEEGTQFPLLNYDPDRLWDMVDESFYHAAEFRNEVEQRLEEVGGESRR